MFDNNYTTIGAITGGVLGTIKGLRNPSEKTCIKLAKTKPSVIDTMKEYRDCFDLSVAGSAVRSGKLSLKEYQTTEMIVDAISDVYEKEKQILDISNTPFEKRTKTFSQAVKEANQARPALYKAMFKLNKDLKSKLIENGIFDDERFLAAMKDAGKKTILTLKEMSKGALKGLAIGIAAGALIGHCLNKIANKK